MSIEKPKHLLVIDTLLNKNQSEPCQKFIKSLLPHSYSQSETHALLEKYLDCFPQISPKEKGEQLQSLYSSLEVPIKIMFYISEFIGNFYKNLQDYILSIRFYEKSLDLSLKSEICKSEEFLIKCSAIECYYYIEQFDKVFQIFNEISKLKKLSKLEESPLIKVYNILAFTHCKNLNWKKAIEFLTLSKDLYEQDKNCGEDLASAYNNLALCYFNISDYRNSKVFYEKSLELYSKTLPAGDKLLGILLLNYGISLAEECDFQNSIEALKKSKKILKKSEQNKTEFPKVYNYLGYCYFKIDEREKAVIQLNKALEVYQNSSDYYLNEFRLTFYFFSLILIEDKQYDLALTCLEKSNSIFEIYIKKKDSIQIKHMLLVGEVYLSQGKYNESLFIFESCLELINSEYSFNSLLAIHASLYLAVNLKVAGDHRKSAEQFSQLFFAVSAEAQMKQASILEVYLRVFDIFYKEKILDFSLIQDGLRIHNLGCKINLKIQFNLFCAADIMFYEQQNFDLSIEYLQKALRISSEFAKSPELDSLLYEKLGFRYYFKEKDYENFFNCLRISLKKTEDPKRLSVNLCCVCGFLYKITEKSKIFEFLEENKAKILSSAGEARLFLAETFKLNGEQLDMQERFDVSLKCYLISLSLFETLKNQPEFKTAKLYMSIGNLHYKLQDLSSSKTYFKTGSDILIKISKDSFNIDFYLTIVKQLELASRYREAITWLNSTITLTKKHLPDFSEIHCLYLFLASCYDLDQNFSMSERNFRLAIQFLETKQARKEELAEFYELFGTFYLKYNKFQEALDLLVKAESLWTDMDRCSPAKCLSLRKMSKCLFEMKMYEKAYEKLEVCQMMLKEQLPDDHLEFIGIRLDIAECLIGMNKIREALEVLNKNFEIANACLPQSHPYVIHGRNLIFRAISSTRFE